MKEDIFEVPENSPGQELDFELTPEDEEYLVSEIFNKGKRKNIDCTSTRRYL